MKFGNLDGQGLAEIQNYNFQRLQTEPSSNLYEGRFYYNTVDHTLYVYNGSEWVDALSQGRVYIAGLGIDATALNNGTIAVSTTIASKTDIGSANLTIQRNSIGIGTFSANATSATTVNISVPTTATEVGALPSTTTINDLTSTAQQNALNSGVTTSIVTQVGTNATAITTINGKIPSQATSTNQLADKAFVNSSIATNTAYFIGTFNSVAELEAYSGTLTNNDYAFVITTDSVGNTAYDRYKYNADTQEWLFEYELNNSSFTSDQWNAINSGITAASVTQIATNTSAISGLSTSKQDKLTAGTNIQINGTTISATDTIYTLPAATTSTLGGVIVGTNLSINNGVLSADAQSITVDTTLSTTSTNPVQNKVITTALAAKSSVTFVDWTV